MHFPFKPTVHPHFHLLYNKVVWWKNMHNKNNPNCVLFHCIDNLELLYLLPKANIQLTMSLVEPGVR